MENLDQYAYNFDWSWIVLWWLCHHHWSCGLGETAVTSGVMPLVILITTPGRNKGRIHSHLHVRMFKRHLKKNGHFSTAIILKTAVLTLWSGTIMQ
jgi:hypothetical protein